MDNLKCCDCKILKDISSFYKNQKRCKECTKIRNKAFREKNPDYFNIKNKQAYATKSKDEKYNKNRYQKYKGRYADYNKEFRQTPRGALYNVIDAIKQRAKKKGYKLDFDLEYLVFLYEKQQGKCALTGIEFNLSNQTRSKRFRPYSVSIDRIDSNKGYSKKNIRLVCVAFNLALNAFGEGVFEKIAKGYLACKS